MMHSDPEVEFRELLRSQAMQEFLAVLDEGPQRCDEYLRQLEEGNRIPSVSMMLVVQKAGNRARDQISLEWAEIAVRAANLWAIEGGSSDPAVALLHA